MKRWLIGLSLLILAAFGCQDRRFINLGSVGEDYDVASQAVDSYAKEHGLTRQEAVKAIRAEQQQLATGDAACTGSSCSLGQASQSYPKTCPDGADSCEIDDSQ
jgi:hypothetical protein